MEQTVKQIPDNFKGEFIVFINDETIVTLLSECREEKIKIYGKIPKELIVSENTYIINVHLVVRGAAKQSATLKELKKMPQLNNSQIIPLGYEIGLSGESTLLQKIKNGIKAIIVGMIQSWVINRN